MKKHILFTLSFLSLLGLASCASTPKQSEAFSTEESYGSAYDYNSEVSIPEPTEISVPSVEGDFALTTADGTFTEEGGIYTITAGGTYALQGALQGQILIAAGEEDEVVLELNGASISYDQDSPIKAISADKVEISAKKNTGNEIHDLRSPKTVDDSTKGEGAIHAKCDLKLKGAGTLIVTGDYNNAVHTTKDLTIQKLSLKATGYNNALKGKASVTIASGIVQAYAKTGNGIKTDDTDLSAKGKQRGSIAIQGGEVYVDSLHDGLDAAYDLIVEEAAAGTPTTLVVKTGKKSSFYSSSFSADSEKGLKAANEIAIRGGTIGLSCSDDAVHANYGDAIASGGTGLGNITIDGGLIQIASGDDGLHADKTLTINGGKLVVTGAVEGLEGSDILITGGESYVYGSDDGVNAANKDFSSHSFTMTGGYLDIAIDGNDVDGIDSNGDFTLSGGTIVTRGAPGTMLNRMSTGLDVDGTSSMSGGTLIAFNGLESAPSTSSSIYYASTSSSSQGNPWGRPGPGGGGGSQSSLALEAGQYHLSGEGIDVSFVNDYRYGSFLIYSSAMVQGASYALSRGDSAVLSWTQSSRSVTIS